MDGADLILPPGFRFHPTDEELVTHYLCRRCAGFPVSVPIIAEVDIYKHDPWQLPAMAAYGEKEWYFFSPRDRKYPNGSRPNRAAGSGYWKATGVDKPIGSPEPAAIKKALVFYAGKAPKGVKTNWIMHEYRLAGVDRSARKKNNLRLDDWVLCRLYHKKGCAADKTVRKAARAKNAWPQPKMEILPRSEMLCFDVAEELPPLRSDSNCSSARMVSPEFKCDKEVESQVKWGDWLDDIEFPLIDGEVTGGFPPMSPVFSNSLQDVLVYLHRPFGTDWPIDSVDSDEPPRKS